MIAHPILVSVEQRDRKLQSLLFFCFVFVFVFVVVVVVIVVVVVVVVVMKATFPFKSRMALIMLT